MNIISKHFWVLCGVYVLLVLRLSTMPQNVLETFPQLFPFQDKIVHTLMYGILTVLLGRALREHIMRNPLAWLLGIVAAATAYGAMMEILQGQMTWIHRSCSWGDMLANLVGAILGAGIFVFYAMPRLSMADVSK